MLVSSNTYLIFIAILVVLIVSFPLYARFVKKQNNKYDIIYFLLLLILPINWYTPTVYTITNCNEYTKEVLLFSTEKDGFSFEIGRKNYIINKSDKTLFFENVYYGNNERQEDEIDVEIAPNTIEKINVVTIDYLFTEPDDTVSTKSNGATKTALYCIE